MSQRRESKQMNGGGVSTWGRPRLSLGANGSVFDGLGKLVLHDADLLTEPLTLEKRAEKCDVSHYALAEQEPRYLGTLQCYSRRPDLLRTSYTFRSMYDLRLLVVQYLAQPSLHWGREEAVTEIYASFRDDERRGT
jgi:hypothetical protein